MYVGKGVKLSRKTWLKTGKINWEMNVFGKGSKIV